ncbi:MAG TPA: DUF3006 domain-containing protein [Candidatus Eisenbergiella merdipullorum]|uniref:DUF3006 domain-containing protein n=1 Tax=Candidatus Eisenbergiella merdipullorum TaxID=2838553 RepID=A0A9D2KYX8_9FIRM|nr:DUF3006 domain-containing protein [Candidatus Eisenbergiella merdipullorum]
MKKENEKTKRQLIVDRKEGEYAVCEQTDKRMISLPLTQLPAGIREGDVLAEENGKYWIDRAATQKRKKEVDAKRRRLFGN